jgi:hypothetical protein
MARTANSIRSYFRTRPLILWGAAFGACWALAAEWTYWSAGHAGGRMTGVGFGTSLVLFFLSLPWSVLVWALRSGIALVTRVDGAAFNMPFFFCMPIVAGAGWGWVIGVLLRRFRPAPGSTSYG